MAVLPAIIGEQCRTGYEVGERRVVGRGHLGARACDQVEFSELLPFSWFRDQRDAAIELIDDLEDTLVAFLPRRVRHE